MAARVSAPQPRPRRLLSDSGTLCRLLLMLEPHLAQRDAHAWEQTAFLSPRRLRSLLSVGDRDVLRLITLRLCEVDPALALTALTQTLSLILSSGE